MSRRRPGTSGLPGSPRNPPRSSPPTAACLGPPEAGGTWRAIARVEVSWSKTWLLAFRPILCGGARRPADWVRLLPSIRCLHRGSKSLDFRYPTLRTATEEGTHESGLSWCRRALLGARGPCAVRYTRLQGPAPPGPARRRRVRHLRSAGCGGLPRRPATGLRPVGAHPRGATTDRRPGVARRGSRAVLLV